MEARTSSAAFYEERIRLLKAEFNALADDALQLCDLHISDEVRKETQRRIIERVKKQP